MKRLLLATRNRDKVHELRAMLADPDLQLLTPDDFPGLGETLEDAETLEENAVKKAREAFLATGVPTLADDSGLEVYYLNNEPGVLSSRYAGPGATYVDNRRKLLARLRGVPPRRRSARFRCVIAFIPVNGIIRTAEGVCPGVITELPRGGNGFGYDPIFLPTRYSLTLAEMDPALKNSLSHRGRATQNIKPVLQQFL